MNTRNILTLIAFGSVVALAACSSTEDDKFGSTDTFCASRSEAYCNGLAKKCAADADTCKRTQAGKCKTSAATASSQSRTYHSNAVQDCLDSINNTYRNSGNDVTPLAETETTAVCERVFSGSKKEADACAQTYECEGALICDKGVCIKEEKVSGKAQCNNAGQTCETDRYCASQTPGAPKFCLDKPKLDEACSADIKCVETLRCVTSRCVARVTAGNPCDNDGECAAPAPYCDTATKKCRPKYESTSAACKDYGTGL